MIISPVVNIHNRCNRRCKCKGGRQLTTSVRTIKEIPGFGYCTHKARQNVKISNVTWKGVDLDRVGGGLHPFEYSTSITVYYYSRLDGKEGSISKPLLIRSKYNTGKTHWFENVGHYANKKWKRITSEAESNQYPTDDKYSRNSKLEEKLKAIACRLFASHGIYISHDKEYALSCPICNRPVNVIVKNYNSELLGYTKYEYSGNFSDKSVLTYKENQITYRRQNKGFPGYYLPMQLESDNVQNVSVYYWSEDKERNTPLLIQIELDNGISYWLENISNDGKHDHWNPIGYAESGTFTTKTNDLKDRLDVLNCIYNKVVQIHVGKQDCHITKHYLHKNRMYYSYGEEFGTYPVLHSYKYLHTMGSISPFNISEIHVKDQKQEFEDGLPFREVKRLTIYISPCDKDKPFLICIESERKHKRYIWYERTNTNGNWKEYTTLDKQAPKRDKTDISNVFNTVKHSLGLQGCYKETTAEGIKVDIREILGKEDFRTYYYRSQKRSVPIFLTKPKDNLLFGFFKNAHRANTGYKHFTLDRELELGGKIGSGASNKINGVEGVYVYFWDGAPTEPILLRIRYTTMTHGKPEYYGKFGISSWFSSQVDNMNEQQALDHQNCMVNNAIPIELTKPNDLEQFWCREKPGCLKNKSVTSSGSPKLPSGSNGTYSGKGYKIPDKTKISRVTHDGKSTNIIPPYGYEGPTLNIYSWREKQKVPLLVEFKPKDGGRSIWYENIGVTSPYTRWKEITNADEQFYRDKDTKNGLTEEFTKKIHEVNCRVHGIVQLDISRTQNEHYCHHSPYGHERRVKVTPLLNGNPFKGYTGYEHTSVYTSKTITISSILYGDKEQTVGGLPLKDVKKVTVYFPGCPDSVPVAIKIEQNGVGTKWFKRKSDTDWVEVSNEFEKLKDISEKMRNLLDEIRTETNACNQPPPKVPPPASSHPILNQVSTINNQELVTQIIGNDKDDNLTFTSIFSPEVTIDEEVYEGFLNDEDEYEDIKEKQNEVILVRKSAANLMGITSLLGYSQVMATSQISGSSKIIIDISKDTEGGPGSSKTYTPEDGKSIYLEKEDDPEGSGFYMFTHESDEVPFRVSQVNYGSEEIPDIIPGQAN